MPTSSEEEEVSPNNSEEDGEINEDAPEIKDLWQFSSSESESFGDAEGADENGCWPVEIISEEVDGLGRVRYEASWKNWSRPDGTNTTWDDGLLEQCHIAHWKRKQTARRKQLARESLDIEIWDTTDIENTATRLREQAFEEKLEIRKQNPLRLEEQMEELLAEKRALAVSGLLSAPTLSRSDVKSGLRSGRSLTRETSASTSGSFREPRPPNSASTSGSKRGRSTVEKSMAAEFPLFTPTPSPAASSSRSKTFSTARAPTSTSTSTSASASISAPRSSQRLKRLTRSWSTERSATGPSDAFTHNAVTSRKGKRRAIETSPALSATSRDYNADMSEDEDRGRHLSMNLPSRRTSRPYTLKASRAESPLSLSAPSFSSSSSSSPPSSRLEKPSSLSQGSSRATASKRKKLEQEWTALARASGAAPITLSNEVDDEEVPVLPPNFRYLESEYLYSNKVPQIEDDDVFVRCECRDEDVDEGEGICEAGVCNCQEPSELVDDEGNKVFAYTPEGLFAFNVPQGVEVIECNIYCRCEASKCPNRVAQRPRDFIIDVFKTRDRGWGVRSPVDIEVGKVLGLYTGLLLRRDVAVAETRLHNFCFDLDGRESSFSAGDIPDNAYSVDALKCGNWARFVNHSCAPNMVVYLVVYDTIPEMNMPYIAFIATEPIPAGTEFTVDYNPAATRAVRRAKRKGRRLPSIPGGAEICRCGAKVCRGWVRAV